MMMMMSTEVLSLAHRPLVIALFAFLIFCAVLMHIVLMRIVIP